MPQHASPYASQPMVHNSVPDGGNTPPQRRGSSTMPCLALGSLTTSRCTWRAATSGAGNLPCTPGLHTRVRLYHQLHAGLLPPAVPPACVLGHSLGRQARPTGVPGDQPPYALSYCVKELQRSVRHHRHYAGMAKRGDRAWPAHCRPCRTGHATRAYSGTRLCDLYNVRR